MKLMSHLWTDDACSIHEKMHMGICWRCLRAQADNIVLLIDQEEADKMHNLSAKELGIFLQTGLCTQYPVSQDIAKWLRQVSLVEEFTGTGVHQVFTLLHFAVEYNFSVRLVFQEEQGVLDSLSYIMMLLQAGFLETSVDGNIQGYCHSDSLDGLSELEIDLTFLKQFALFTFAQQIYLPLDSISIL
ncbi:hypothetical protein HOD19_04070 [bacterium]|jgi:hypothetical protein|nr:hypothetical protein [bacterium]MBT4648795.1 hypothetical protein [bacterium]